MGYKYYMKKIKTYNIGKATTFDLNQLSSELEPGKYTIKTQAISVNGKKSPESAGIKYTVEVDPLNPLRLPPFTIRCKYKAGVTPSPHISDEHSVEMNWDSQKLVDATENIWDITKNSTDWTRMLEFQEIEYVLGANTTGVTNMFALFNLCYKSEYGEYVFGLQGVAPFDTSSVTNISFMFNTCKYLQSLPLFDFGKVTTMEAAFVACEAITSIPLFNTSSCINMKKAFYKCSHVQSGALALYNQASTQATEVTNHSMTFYECGLSTETGMQELKQIPTDWGGKA